MKIYRRYDYRNRMLCVLVVLSVLAGVNTSRQKQISNDLTEKNTAAHQTQNCYKAFCKSLTSHTNINISRKLPPVICNSQNAGLQKYCLLGKVVRRMP